MRIFNAAKVKFILQNSKIILHFLKNKNLVNLVNPVLNTILSENFVILRPQKN